MDDSKLSQLATQWSLVLEVCRGPGDAVRAGQSEVLERYCGAIYRYALKALGDPDLAAEACQEFALRFVRGDFRHANPARGRFRDYVKTSVIHLLGEFRRKKPAEARPLPDGAHLAVSSTPAPPEVAEAEFLAIWRKELINRAWREMEAREDPSGPPYYAALRAKADGLDLTASELADRLDAAGRGRYTPAGVRQVLHRARETFADLLLAEVARAALTNDSDRLAEELADLDLLTYCRQALERRRR